MSVLFVLVPMALLLAAAAAIAFVWAARSGQMDDLETPAMRILMDDDGSARTRPAATGEPRLNPSDRSPGHPAAAREAPAAASGSGPPRSTR